MIGRGSKYASPAMGRPNIPSGGAIISNYYKPNNSYIDANPNYSQNVSNNAGRRR